MTRTSAGTLSALALSLINGGAAVRTWTITPASVADGSGFSIPYTTGALGVVGGSAGDTFNVTAAPNTSYTVDGGPLPIGTLNYNAQGRAVSGASLAAPSGEIDSPTVKPVKFTEMATVKIAGAKPPNCVLKASSRTVSHARSKHPRSGQAPPTTLTLRVTCDQSATVTLAGTITELLRPGTNHRKPRTKTVRIPPTHASVSARLAKSLTIIIPAGAARALAAHVPESASFRLTATNTNGTGTASLKLQRLSA